MRVIFLVLIFFLGGTGTVFADCSKEDICNMVKTMTHFAILDQCPDAAKTMVECKKVSEKPLEELPTPDFSANENGTVTDKVNKLMWTKSGIKEKFSLKQAHEFALNSEEADLVGWRIPTLPELKTLLQDEKIEHAGGKKGWIHPAFNDDGEYYYWTQTTCEEVSFIVDRYQKKICQQGGGAAWLINFKAGAIIWHYVTSKKFYVWLVRDLEEAS